MSKTVAETLAEALRQSGPGCQCSFYIENNKWVVDKVCIRCETIEQTSHIILLEKAVIEAAKEHQIKASTPRPLSQEVDKCFCHICKAVEVYLKEGV